MVAEVFGNIASSILGGVLGEQANARGVMLSYEQQKQLMKDQAKINWKYYTKDLLEKYNLGRQGLEAANYNPMLALGGVQGNSSWASQASINDTGSGTAFNSGMANATQMNAVRQQGNLIDSQVQNNNADSVLKQNQSDTELVKQLDIQNDARLKDSQRILTDKHSSNFEREQAREDKKVAIEYRKMQNDYKIQSMRNRLYGQQVQSQRLLNGQLSNAQSIQNQIRQIEADKLKGYYNNNGGLPQYLFNVGQSARDILPFGKSFK